MRRFGLDYAALSAGSSGADLRVDLRLRPDRARRGKGGFDLIAQGVSGLMSITGEPGGPPVKVGVPITDLGAGLFALAAILAALHYRTAPAAASTSTRRSSRPASRCRCGRRRSTFGGGVPPEPLGSAHRMIAPYQAIRCADGYITLGAANDRLFERLCDGARPSRVGGRPRLRRRHAPRAQPRRAASRASKRSRASSRARTGSRCLDGAASRAGRSTTTRRCSPIRRFGARDGRRDRSSDARPHADAGLADEDVGDAAVVGRRAPLLGEHTREVLREAGYDESEIRAGDGRRRPCRVEPGRGISRWLRPAAANDAARRQPKDGSCSAARCYHPATLGVAAEDIAPERPRLAAEDARRPLQESLAGHRYHRGRAPCIASWIPVAFLPCAICKHPRGFMSTYSDFAGISATVRMAGVFCRGMRSRSCLANVLARSQQASWGTTRPWACWTTTGGANWIALGAGPGSGSIEQLQFVGDSGVLCFARQGSSIVRSVDGGRAWDVVFAASPHLSILGPIFAVNPVAPSVIYVGTRQGVMVTTDAGAHWAIRNRGITRATTSSHCAKVNRRRCMPATVANSSPVRTMARAGRSCVWEPAPLTTSCSRWRVEGPNPGSDTQHDVPVEPGETVWLPLAAPDAKQPLSLLSSQMVRMRHTGAGGVEYVVAGAAEWRPVRLP